jgi:hypothetical protein
VVYVKIAKLLTLLNNQSNFGNFAYYKLFDSTDPL